MIPTQEQPTELQPKNRYCSFKPHEEDHFIINQSKEDIST